ncbi:hypothetical protein B0H11DRAFT_1671365, partial [Mycena galericulata]
NLTDLTKSTLTALYAQGHVDQQLKYGLGYEDLYREYIINVGNLLSRPNAIAFIAAGGLLSFIAQMYDNTLVSRFLHGPSVQVTEFQRGGTLVHTVEGEQILLMTDSVSSSEIALLIGSVPSGNPKTDVSLWPHPSVFESDSLHVHGAWTPGCYKILQNLRAEIEDGHYKWRTRKQWGSYFRAGNSGVHAPPPHSTPSKADFDLGMELVHCAFPIEWNKMRLRDIQIPE